MKEINNPRKNNPVEHSKNGKFHKSPITSVPVPETSQNIIFPHTKSLICPEHMNNAGFWMAGCWLARRLRQFKASPSMNLGITFIYFLCMT